MYRPCGRRVAGDPSATWWVSRAPTRWPDRAGVGLVDDDGHPPPGRGQVRGQRDVSAEAGDDVHTAFIEDVADRRNSAGKP